IWAPRQTAVHQVPRCCSNTFYFVPSMTLPLNALALMSAEPSPNFVLSVAPGPYCGRSACAPLSSLLIPPLNVCACTRADTSAGNRNFTLPLCVLARSFAFGASPPVYDTLPEFDWHSTSRGVTPSISTLPLIDSARTS